MKNLERIKSEDLAAQVQDANPGNFAIEQEVAQLVGATVPAPTEPSADDARELGAQLLVFLRRALLPIRSALRTAVAAIYAHLDSRCTDYTLAAYDPFRLPAGPYDPMRPFVPRTLPNLLTALTAFSDRKISGVPEAADGISLVRLLNDPSGITELTDDTEYVMTRSLSVQTAFPNVTKVTLGCTQTIQSGYSTWGGTLLGSDCEYHLPKLKKITPQASGIGFSQQIFGFGMSHDIYCPELEEIKNGSRFGLFGGINGQGTTAFAAYLPKLRKVGSGSAIFCPYNAGSCGITTLVLGTIEESFALVNTTYSMSLPDLQHLEFGEGTCASLNLNGWNPTDKGTTFLQNFREHIALRLTANGSGKTLTLSQAVRNAIHAAESTYGIENIIVTQKGWTISPAPGASSQ